MTLGDRRVAAENWIPGILSAGLAPDRPITARCSAARFSVAHLLWHVITWRGRDHQIRHGPARDFARLPRPSYPRDEVMPLWSRLARETPDSAPPGRKAEDHDRTATAHLAAQAAGRRDTPGRDQLVPAALAAEGKAAKTIRKYTEAVQWFAAAHLLGQTRRASWEQVGSQDIQQWMTWLLDRYSSAYASNQYRALHQFFKWLAAEDEIPDPMAGLKPPRVPDKPVPVFTAGDLPRLERACAGRAFAERRDAALIAVFRATGMRLSELAGIRYDPDDPRRSDIDLWHRELTVQGKGRKTRVVKISFDAARSLDRYLRVRARHAQAYRPQLWLGVSNRGPMTAS